MTKTEDPTHIAGALSAIRIRLVGTCGYCEQPVPMSVRVDDAPLDDAEQLADWLDFDQAAPRCTCLNDVLWKVGHRSTQRKLIRIEREDMAYNADPEFEDRKRALEQRWLELQPIKKNV